MTFNWNQYVFVDAETTGLNHREHALLEVTYAVGLMAPVTLFAEGVEDVLADADPRALNVNKYLELYLGDDQGKWVTVPNGMGDSGYFRNSGEHKEWLDLPKASTIEEWLRFLVAIEGKTWVGLNPEFDVNFVQEYLYPEHILEHHHRLFNVRSWWAGYNNDVDLVNPPTLYPPFDDDIVSAPYVADHTSLMDVLAMRQAFIARTEYLRDMPPF